MVDSGRVRFQFFRHQQVVAGLPKYLQQRNSGPAQGAYTAILQTAKLARFVGKRAIRIGIGIGGFACRVRG